MGCEAPTSSPRARSPAWPGPGTRPSPRIGSIAPPNGSSAKLIRVWTGLDAGREHGGVDGVAASGANAPLAPSPLGFRIDGCLWPEAEGGGRGGLGGREAGQSVDVGLRVSEVGVEVKASEVLVEVELWRGASRGDDGALGGKTPVSPGSSLRAGRRRWPRSPSSAPLCPHLGQLGCSLHRWHHREEAITAHRRTLR